MHITPIFEAGSLGLLHLQMVRHEGAVNITVCDLKKDMLKLAKKLGADGVPSVVENAVKFVKNNDKLMIFGVCPPPKKLV